MKAKFLNVALAVVGFTFFTACNSEKQSETESTANEQTETKQEVAGVTYTCPMHPEVISREPGKCPECGMNLEEVKAGEHEDHAGDQH